MCGLESPVAVLKYDVYTLKGHTILNWLPCSISGIVAIEMLLDKHIKTLSTDDVMRIVRIPE